ncbi:TetR/AcrR family transcriptional regulator [Candidatus Allofournierella excrementavium]|uniref:TetR/AcrR family transcriptional regulator n=1 Tax=Candidatus Allofournierella excrementavium TaxID=2838591 RepID=UPI003A8A2BF2
MDDTRKRCIRETIALCSGQGLDFTMSELAARLGMSKKTLYVLFESKEALLLATVDSMFDEVKVSEAEILARRDLSLAEKIRRLVVVLPDSYQTLDWTRLQGVEEKYPVVYRRIRQRLETGWEPTLDLLRQGVEQRVLRPFEPGLFRAVVEGAIEHFLSSDALEREGLGYVQAMDGMMDLLMEGILTRREEKA